MLVTFRTKHYANITMFGDVAVRLLRLMGHTGTVPSALLAADVPAALERLRAGLAEHGTEVVGERADEDSEEPDIDLARRAVPLIELLESAVKFQADVMWDS
jgi:hypothetical protein